MPEHTVKAIAAYVIGARPQSEHRRVFLTRLPPFRPMSPNGVGHHITKAMKNAESALNRLLVAPHLRPELA